MEILLLTVAAAVAGGVLYRVRGGWDPVPIHGTQAARLVWCLPTGWFLWWLSGGPLWLWPATALAAFLGLLIPHGFGMIWPVTGDRPTLRAIGMALVGVVRVALAVAPCAWIAAPWLWWAVAFGPLHALVYWIGWRLPVPAGWRNDERRPVDAETAWAEIGWGAVQWASLAALSA